MGYQISYEPELNYRYKIPGKKPKKRIWGIYGTLVLGTVVLGLIPSIRNWFWDLLIPGDPKVTIPTFAGFMEDIQQGTGFSDALTVFCQEILVNA